MTHRNNYTFSEDLVEKGLEAVPEMMRVLINQAMQVERSKYLQADEYERTEERKGHANGYKPKTVRTRMGEISYLYVNARYEKVREAGQVRDAAVLVASGITPEGERQILGVSVSLSEHETHWKAFLKGLKDRGLNGMKLIISDDHEGLGAARRAVFGSVPWQRCQFHLQQNAGAYLPKQHMRLEVAADIRSMFNAPDRKTAEELLQAAIQKYAVSVPHLSAWLEDNLSEVFSFFDFPLEHRRTIRTTNSLERINKEIRKRTRVVGVFPNEASCLRLSSALLMEIRVEWQIGKHYCAGKSLGY